MLKYILLHIYKKVINIKKVISFVLVVSIQVFIVGFFFNKTLGKNVNVYKQVNIVHNNNLDKIATSVSVLFDEDQDSKIVLVDDTVIQDLPSLYKEVKEEKKLEEEVKEEKYKPMYLIDAEKYSNNKAMGFVVTDNNKNYTLTDKEFDVVVAVVAGEYDLNLNDALAVMSVILNRCDSKSWAKWAGPSPYDQVVMKGQFEVYFAGYYLDYMPGGNKYGKQKYEVARQAVLDGLNGIRNNKYLGFRAWWVSEYSDKYIVAGGNRYGYN